MSKTEELLEDKYGYLQKHGVKGIVSMLLAAVLTYGGAMVEDYLRKYNVAAIKSSIVPLRHSISLLQSTVKDMETMIINCKGGVKVLNADEINKIVRNAATLKAQRIRDDIVQLLYRYEHNTPAKLSKFRAKVKEVMQDSRKIYMSDVKGLQQRGIGTVQKYLSCNFPRKRYLATIMKVIASSSSATDKYQIAGDAYTYMLDIQDVFLTDMYKMMKAAE